MAWKTIQSTVWDRLSEEKRPIVLYGMGDGADKIRAVFAKYGIEISGVFASDEFVRGHSYAGFRVEKLSQVIERLGEDIVVVISFASQRSEVLEKLYALDARFDTVAPDVPVAGTDIFDLDYARLHESELDAAYALMSDDLSRAVFDDMVSFKLTGKISYLRAHETDKDEAFGNILKPGVAEHFADLGAYNGDTIRELLHYTDGAYASVTALEPDRRNFRKLTTWAEQALTGEARLLQAGAWEKDDTLYFAAKAGRQSALREKEGVPTAVRALDSVLAGRPCTMLKLDVEGAERQALAGAAQTIAQYRPRLNVACYHRSEDLFALPLQLHELCPSYRLYLRHHPYVPAWDVNLYASAGE